MHAHTHTHMYAHMCTHMYAHMYAHMCTHMYAHIYTHRQYSVAHACRTTHLLSWPSLGPREMAAHGCP